MPVSSLYLSLFHYNLDLSLKQPAKGFLLSIHSSLAFCFNDLAILLLINNM
ncbi:hypothetical protein HanRHA438_Chr08g0331241 [Helianthus annuus]|nr:hypothetical protein HanOQP8_Chr08g0270891 [Helianthus annuus]KAJ0896160.1 hypothetical protein HanRHA438_Chr08g0331241 [Helianthus annuus]KAJ0900167.1 hypothetical protein HanPSC8_Chr08g0310361 [Helianthus annuus]